jgi:hypothetical protein
MANIPSLSILAARLLPTADEVHYGEQVIGAIDQEIIKLELQIQDLRRKKGVYASWMSPFRRLPTEILREILGMALKEGEKPTTITRICSRLRYIAFGISQFWNEIRLREPLFVPKSRTTPDWEVRLYLE